MKNEMRKMNETQLGRYKSLLDLVGDRKNQLVEFLEYLHTETSWETSPASTRFHANQEGGLLDHSVRVAENALKLRAALAPNMPEESCVIAGLFHDLGKIGYPGKPRYLKNTNEWEIRHRDKNFVINPELTAMGLGMQSLWIVGMHFTLTEAEAQAIAYADGPFVPEYQAIAHREHPLTLLTHWADFWSGHVLESPQYAALAGCQ